MVIEERKVMFENGQAELNVRTETLSGKLQYIRGVLVFKSNNYFAHEDVCARRRLRASRSIIGLATRAARLSRLEFERILRTCSSEIDFDVNESRYCRRLCLSIAISITDCLRIKRIAVSPPRVDCAFAQVLDPSRLDLADTRASPQSWLNRGSDHLALIAM